MPRRKTTSPLALTRKNVGENNIRAMCVIIRIDRTILGRIFEPSVYNGFKYVVEIPVSVDRVIREETTSMNAAKILFDALTDNKYLLSDPTIF